MGIDFEVSDRIAKIVINRPEALNSMTQPMYADLSKAWIEVRDNPDIWVAVVTGAPQPDRSPERQVFTAGADLRSMNRERGVDQYWLTQRAPILNRGLEVWKPVVCAVNGLCLAGGMTLLSARNRQHTEAPQDAPLYVKPHEEQLEYAVEEMYHHCECHRALHREEHGEGREEQRAESESREERERGGHEGDSMVIR
jgi:Enoyl-CoA hydratase/isomerase